MTNEFEGAWILNDVQRKTIDGAWPVYEPPVFTNDFGLIAGGGGGSGIDETNVVQRLDYSNDTADTSIRCQLTQRRRAMAAVTNLSYFWCAGGTYSPVSIAFNIVDRVTLASDTTNAVDRCDLTVGRNGLAGVTNGIYGWCVGGNDVNFIATNIIDRLDFAADTTNCLDRCDLNIANSGVVGSSNGTYGWILSNGGSAPLPNYNNVERITYASDTTNASVRCAMDKNRRQAGAVADGTYSWYSGGLDQWNGTTNTTIGRITHANDTVNGITRGSSTVADSQTVGVTNGTYGYFCGGGNGNRVERMTFSNDTATSVDRGDLYGGSQLYAAAGCQNSSAAY